MKFLIAFLTPTTLTSLLEQMIGMLNIIYKVRSDLVRGLWLKKKKKIKKILNFISSAKKGE